MKIKLLIIFFSSFFLLNFCDSIKKVKNLEGAYVSKSKIGSEEIYLYKDSTFSYKFQIPLIKSESKGLWKLHNNLIVLNSFKEFKNDYFEVIELSQDSNSTIIKVVDESNNPLAGVNLKVNNFSNNLVTDLNGSLVDKNISFKKDLIIEIFSIDLSLDKNKYLIKNNSTKSLIIKIYRKTNEKKYFFNDTLIVKKNKLIFNNTTFKKVRE